MRGKKTEEQSFAVLLEDDHGETLEKSDEFQNLLTHLQYEGKASFGKNLKKLREVSRFFNRQVGKHMKEEEKLLFPFLQSHVPKLEPLISLLVSEHRQFKKGIECFQFLLGRLTNKGGNIHRNGKAIEELKEEGNYLVCLLRGHLQEESEILYRVANRELRREEKRDLQKLQRRQSHGARRTR